MLSLFSGSFSACQFVCLLANDLCIYKQKVGEVLHKGFLSYRVMARLLDFIGK